MLKILSLIRLQHNLIQIKEVSIPDGFPPRSPDVLRSSLLFLLQDLNKQLDEVTQNSEIIEIRQKEAECELEAARDRVQQQATEILLKASESSGPVEEL